MLPVEEKIVETKSAEKQNSFDEAFEALGLNGEFMNREEEKESTEKVEEKEVEKVNKDQ